MKDRTAQVIIAAVAFAVGLGLSGPMARWARAQSGPINCLDPTVAVRWNPQCKQLQNWWFEAGAQSPRFFYYDPWLGPPQDLKWSVDRTSFARIHELYGQVDPNTNKRYSADQLTYYPRRAASLVAPKWSGISGLDLVEVKSGGRVRVYAKEAHKYKHETRNSLAYTDIKTTYKPSRCGDGAQERCYKNAYIYVNGGYGWLPTHDAPVTLCCLVAGTHSKPDDPQPPSHVVGWWGVAGMETTLIHEFGHSVGLWHVSGSGCPTFSVSRMKTINYTGVSTCWQLDILSSDVIAARYLYGHP